MEKTVLIIDDKAINREDSKWAAESAFGSVNAIEATDKNTALGLIERFKKQIFAVICDGDLGDGDPFGGLEILDVAKKTGIKHLIFYASMADQVPEKRKQEGIHYTTDLLEVKRILQEADIV